MTDLTQTSFEVKHLSPSKIEAMMKCPEQFRLRYVEKIPEPSIGVMLVGRVIHALIEHALKRVVAGGQLPGAKEFDDWFIPEWDEQVKEEEEKSSFIGWVWDAEDPEHFAKSGARDLLVPVLTDLLPTIRPRFVEETAKLTYRSDIGDFLVWGQLDLMDELGVVHDWKITTKSVSANQKKGWFQFAHYSRFAFELTQQEVTPVRKTFLVRGRRKNPIEVIPFSLGQAHRDWFARCAAETWKAIKAEAYVPNTSGWWCGKDWCSFHAMCQGELT